MPSLPTVGQPDWGDDLNDFLEVGHQADGQLRSADWQPRHQNMKLWTMEWTFADLAADWARAASQRLELYRLNVPRTETLANIHFVTLTTAAGLGAQYFGIYNSAGALIGKSADAASKWETVGFQSVSLTPEGPGLTVPGGPDEWVYATWLDDGLAASPSGIRGFHGDIDTSPFNALLTASGGYRIGLYGSGLTTLPSSIVIGNVVTPESLDEDCGLPLIGVS